VPWAGRAAGTGFLTYAVDHFPVRLIAVDIVTSQSNRGDFCPERVQVLVDLIDAERTTPIAAFMHHLPFGVEVGPDPLYFVMPEAMARLRQALRPSGRVTAVFCGHFHRSIGGRIGEISAMMAPCTASALRKGDYPPPILDQPVYHLHRFDSAYGFGTEAKTGAAAPGSTDAARGA
jgi:Icc protein